MRRRRARRKAVCTRAPIIVEARDNMRWPLDFVHDQFANGRRFPCPSREGNYGHRDDGRHELGHLIGEPLDRRAGSLGPRYYQHNLRKQRIAPQLLGSHHEPAGFVQRAGDHFRPKPLCSQAWTRRSQATHRATSALR